MTFSITQKENPSDVLYFVLSGDLDISSAPDLKQSVLAAYREDPKNIIFDFEFLNYLDSTGLGTFISVYKNVKENGHGLKMIHCKPNVRKLFTITELDRIFTMED